MHAKQSEHIIFLLKIPHTHHWNSQAVQAQYSSMDSRKLHAKIVVKSSVTCLSLWFAQYMACIPIIDMVTLKAFFAFKHLPGTEAYVLEA